MHAGHAQEGAPESDATRKGCPAVVIQVACEMPDGAVTIAVRTTSVDLGVDESQGATEVDGGGSGGGGLPEGGLCGLDS